MNTKVHFSSASDNWATPQATFDKLNADYDFEWDVCASLENTKVKGCFFDVIDDGLSQDWSKTASRLWMNPPYGRTIGSWVKKARDEAAKGCLVVCLLPARVDTKWFHEYIYNNEDCDFRFIKGRLKFGDAKNSAPFPSMIVIFHPVAK